MIWAEIVIFLLAIVNLIATSIMIYFKKQNWALALAIVEIVLVYLSFQV